MFTQTDAEKNPTSVLILQPHSQMPWRVAQVEVIDDLAFRVRFLDGMSGIVRFEATWLTGVFEALKDPALFRQAYVEHGAVTWPGELDLAPDAMYDEIKKNGEWVLR